MILDFKLFINPHSYTLQSKESSIIKKIKTFFICLFLLYLSVFIISIFQIVVDIFIEKISGISLKKIIFNEQVSSTTKLNYLETFIYFCLIYPIIEELIHRLPLILNKWNISISLSLVFLINYDRNLFFFDLNEKSFWLKILIIVFIFFTLHFIKIDNFKLGKVKYFIYFYFMALTFSFLHIGNFYSALPKKFIFISIIFVLPQFFLGIISSYLRLKNGILYSFLIHIIFNTSVFILNNFIK